MSEEGKKRNLVLGRGLIGSRLIAALEGRGEEVRVLSRGDGHDLKEAGKHFDLFQWADRVWFVAWEIGTWKTATSPAYQASVLDSSLRLCESVFDCLQRSGKPFLFVSSHASVDASVLGAGKRVGEVWTRILGGHIARLWNVYGWEPVGERSHLIPDLIAKGLQGRIELMTNGEETREFLHVEDCVEAFIHQMDIGQKEADVTTWQPVAIRKVAGLISEKLGSELVLGQAAGKPMICEPRVRLEGWTPRLSLEAGLELTIQDAKTWINSH